MLAGYEAVYNKITEYLGVGAIPLVFLCAACVLAFRRDNSERMKAYLLYALCMMLAAMNPVTVLVLGKLGHLDVLERFFWLLMTPVIIAVCGSLLSEKSKALLVAALLLIILSGRTVFTHIEFKKAENPYKISNAAIAVSDIIMRDFEGIPEDGKLIDYQLGNAEVAVYEA